KERDKGFRAANFTYGAKPDHPEMVEVLKEVNGVATEDITDKEGKVLYKKGQPIASFAQLTDDGKTTSGCWIYTGVTVESPDGKIWKVPDQKNELAPVGSKDYPYVITTYRLTEHHLSGVMSRYLPMLAELHHSHFAEISHELAKELRIENGEKITVLSPRG